MKVKIETEGVFNGERVGVGSVVEIDEEIYNLNTSWMEPTGDPLNKVKPAAEKPVKPDGDK